MVPDYFQTLLQYASYRLAGPEDKGAETMGGERQSLDGAVLNRTAVTPRA